MPDFHTDIHWSQAQHMGKREKLVVLGLKTGSMVMKGTNAVVTAIKLSKVELAQGFKYLPYVGSAISVVGLVGTFFSARENIRNLKDSSIAKRVRLIPAALLAVNAGDIVSLAYQSKNWIAEAIHKGASALPAMSTATTVLGSFLVGLQVLATSVDILELRSLRKQIKLFRGKTSAADKVHHLSEQQKGTSRLFDAFSKKQKGLMKEIHSTKGGSLDGLDGLVEKIEHRFKFLKNMKALSIAIGIIAIVGVVLLSFAPTPLAPLGWAVMGTAVALGISRLVTMLVYNHRFTKMLEQEKNGVQAGYQRNPYAP